MKYPRDLELFRRLKAKRRARAPAWTLFITGPRIREWGFHCPGRGWVHWREFTAADDSGSVGAGCDA